MLSEVKIGDTVKFSKLPQIQLSNKNFLVSKAGKYEFKNITHTFFTIHDDLEVIHIADILDGNGKIGISRILTDEELSKLFNLKEFTLIFSDDLDLKVHTKNEIKSLESWIEGVYVKDFDYVEGTYYEDKNGKHGDKFYYYTISARDSSIDIEVLDSGKIFFYITIYLSHSSLTIK